MAKKRVLIEKESGQDKFRVGIEENGVVRTSDGKSKSSKDCPKKKDAPYFEKGGNNDNA